MLTSKLTFNDDTYDVTQVNDNNKKGMHSVMICRKYYQIYCATISNAISSTLTAGVLGVQVRYNYLSHNKFKYLMVFCVLDLYNAYLLVMRYFNLILYSSA